MTAMTALNLSAPLATLLKTSTADAHDKASQSESAGWLTRGELDKDEYIRYLIMLYYIYDTFERALDQHASHPVLLPSYNPSLLARTASLTADIAYLLQVPESEWQAHPIHVELMAAPPRELTDYTSRLQILAESSDPSRLLAHSYVRYLGDLSGGQFVRRRLAKVYGLEDGLGLSFYEFKQLGGSASGTIGDMKKIKEWYRDGMNAGVGDDVVLKEAILDEANIAFDLNSGLFNILRPPQSTSPSPTPPSPGELSTSTSDSDSSSSSLASDLSSLSSSTKILQEAPTTSTYHVSTVVAVIAAISLSHFLLVAGGFTGEQGAAKLEAVQRWLAATFAGSA